MLSLGFQEFDPFRNLRHSSRKSRLDEVLAAQFPKPLFKVDFIDGKERPDLFLAEFCSLR